MKTMQKKLFAEPKTKVSVNVDGEIIIAHRPKIVKNTYYTASGLVIEITKSYEVVSRKLIKD